MSIECGMVAKSVDGVVFKNTSGQEPSAWSKALILTNRILEQRLPA